MQNEYESEEINEVACLDSYMKKYNISKAKLSKDLKIAPQFISRVFIQEDRDKLPPALKFALLKYYYYDVETDTELGNSLQENVTKVYFYSYSPNEIIVEDLKSTDYINFDTRWLKNILGVNPDYVFMYQIQEEDYEKFYMPLPFYRLHIDDIVMVDKSVKTSNRRAYFLVKNGDQLQIKLLSMDWDGSNTIEYCMHRRDYSSDEPTKREQLLDMTNIDILGKIVWNANTKMFR